MLLQGLEAGYKGEHVNILSAGRRYRGLTNPDLREYSFFVQDEWRPTADLTVNGGLRYDLMKTAAPAVRNPDPQLAARDIDTSRLNASSFRFSRYGCG